MKTATKLWIFLAIAAILTPLGLILPECLKSGPAWGEWSAAELGKIAGYIPDRLGKLANLWTAPFPDYAFKSAEGASLAKMSLAYIVSAMIGLAVIAGIFYIIGRSMEKNDKQVKG